MAKKRGRKKKSQESLPKHEVPGGFWRQVVAVLVIFASILLVVSWFDTGGPALAAIKGFLLNMIGNSYYILPVIMIYLSVMVFRSDNNRLCPSVIISAILMLLWGSGLCGAPSYGTGGVATGGKLGDLLNSVMRENFNLPVSVAIYVVLIVITALFMYARTPAELFRSIGNFFRGSQDREDVENARVARRIKNPKHFADEEESEEEPRRTPKLKIRGEEEGEEKEKPEKRGLFGRKKVEEPTPVVAEEAKAVIKEPSAPIIINDSNWKMPSMTLLDKKKTPADPGDVQKNSEIIRDTYAQFNIDVVVEGANIGPRITQFELTPPAGIKVAKLAQYDRDLALGLASDKIRIEAPIPGTRLVGVEVPNVKAASVGLHELLRSDEWKRMAADKPLAFTVGKDIAGKVVVSNLAKMPHLLIAGTTGSGKSVMTGVLINSLLFHNSPADLRFIMVDPKQVEMATYNDIPHLLAPVITSTDKALSALKWSVGEMERRYSLMAKRRVKTIVDYNKVIAGLNEMEETVDEEDAEPETKLPYIVIIVDEMADLMMAAGKELEGLIVRIAQKGRAAGMHLVLATQRPEAKVVTGLIKSNVPGRIAFAVNNNIDSRVMLDMTGAEKLLGAGDMLFLTTEMSGKPIRIQGAYIDDKEIIRVTDYLRQQGPPRYNDEVISQAASVPGMPGGGGDYSGGGADDELNFKGAMIAIESGKLSTSLLGRRLSIGYGKAARIIDNLEQMGVIGPATTGNRPREVLISSMDEYPGPRFD